MAQADLSTSRWPFIKKLLFCFVFILFLLYIFLNPNEVVPYSYYLHILYIQPFNNLVEWLAKDVFHFVNPSIQFYNSTIDTIFGYITALFIVLVALIAALIWVLIYSKTNNYNRLHKILILILRYYLAITLIAYGAIKIIKLQFPALSPAMLVQTYGNSTPKDLAWAFMGYSTGYNYFLGFIELGVGLMLFFRRTSTLGSLIALGIIANVVAFNYSFDVNVKLLTTVLLLMTLFLLLKDITRLANFFFLNKTIYPENDAPVYFKAQWKNTALVIAKCAFIVFIVFFDLHGDFIRAKQNTEAMRSPLYGVYNISTFIIDRDTLKPLTTDTVRWNQLIIGSPQGSANVILMNGTSRGFLFKADTLNSVITLCAKKDKSDKYTFTYNRDAPGTLILTGNRNGHPLKVELKRFDIDKFPLMGHRFRWIIDRNLNRGK
jgi:hypothetical protein